MPVFIGRQGCVASDGIMRLSNRVCFAWPEGVATDSGFLLTFMRLSCVFLARRGSSRVGVSMNGGMQGVLGGVIALILYTQNVRVDCIMRLC